jgi:hypothetical protein
MRTQVQRELDRAEEYLLDKLFGSATKPAVGPAIGLILNLNGLPLVNLINNKITELESCAKDYMKDDGTINGPVLSEYLVERYPCLKGLSLPNITPTELVDILGDMVDLDKVGYYIQNI